jgi:hypothetical protein
MIIEFRYFYFVKIILSIFVATLVGLSISASAHEITEESREISRRTYECREKSFQKTFGKLAVELEKEKLTNVELAQFLLRENAYSFFHQRINSVKSSVDDKVLAYEKDESNLPTIINKIKHQNFINHCLIGLTIALLCFFTFLFYRKKV